MVSVVKECVRNLAMQSGSDNEVFPIRSECDYGKRSQKAVARIWVYVSNVPYAREQYLHGRSAELIAFEYHLKSCASACTAGAFDFEALQSRRHISRFTSCIAYSDWI